MTDLELFKTALEAYAHLEDAPSLETVVDAEIERTESAVRFIDGAGVVVWRFVLTRRAPET